MKLMRAVLVLFVVVAVLGLVANGTAQEPKQKGKGKAVNGKVLKVSAESITIKSADKKKKGEVVEAGKEMTFKITAETKVVRKGKEKGDQPTPATVGDLKEGVNVSVAAAQDSPETAARIMILGEGKKNKDNQ